MQLKRKNNTTSSDVESGIKLKRGTRSTTYIATRSRNKVFFIFITILVFLSNLLFMVKTYGVTGSTNYMSHVEKEKHQPIETYYGKSTPQILSEEPMKTMQQPVEIVQKKEESKNYVSHTSEQQTVDIHQKNEHIAIPLIAQDPIQVETVEKHEESEPISPISSQKQPQSQDLSQSPQKERQVSDIIHFEYPSAETIESILTEELKFVDETFKPDEKLITDLSKIYELTYALIAAFQRNNIPIFVGFGSHLGARRHHGIIPFGEKDVDFQIFSVDAAQVRSIIRETLDTNSIWSKLQINPHDFGFQLGADDMHKLGFPHYIDFWLFADRGEGVLCVGPCNKGCDMWYKHFFDKKPPVFDREDYFPPKYQVRISNTTRFHLLSIYLGIHQKECLFTITTILLCNIHRYLGLTKFQFLRQVKN